MRYSITTLSAHFKRYYNFEEAKFDLDSFKPSVHNYKSNYSECFDIYTKLLKIEQSKPYGCADTILMWDDNNIINR
jgi:hypothetical protein